MNVRYLGILYSVFQMMGTIMPDAYLISASLRGKIKFLLISMERGSCLNMFESRVVRNDQIGDEWRKGGPQASQALFTVVIYS